MIDEIILFLASFLIWLLFAGLVVLWFIDGKIKKEQVVHALLASFLAFTVAEILKQIFHTSRPFQVDGLGVMTLTKPLDPAFPSTHAAVAFALAITVWLHDRKVGLFFVILAISIAWARVAANVHYPIDVIVGAIIGGITALAIEKVHLQFNGGKRGVDR